MEHRRKPENLLEQKTYSLNKSRAIVILGTKGNLFALVITWFGRLLRLLAQGKFEWYINSSCL